MLTILTLAVLGCIKATPPQSSQPEQVAGSTAEVPAARVEDMTDTYHGVVVADPYRWLEDWDDPSVKAWSEAQNALARADFDAIDGRDVLRDDLAALVGAEVVTHYPVVHAANRIFAERHQPPKPQSFLVELSSLDAEAEHRVIFDPTDDELAHIDWFVPSPDGELVAISVSRAGSESGDLRILDTDTLEQVDTTIPRVNGGTAGGALAWAADSSGFWYTRYPRAGERDEADMAFYTQAWFHTIGSEEDRYEIGEDFPRIVEIDFETHPSGRMLVTTQLGDGGQFSHHLRETDGTFRALSVYGDKTVMVTFSEDGESLYAVSFTDAPRGKILKAPVTGGLDDAHVFLPEGPDTVVTSFWSPPSLRELGGRLFVEFQTGGPSTIRAFDMSGSAAVGPALLEVSSVGSMSVTGDGKIQVGNCSYTKPWTWFTFDPATNETKEVPVNQPHPADLSTADVRREFALSKDGTRIPVNILLPAGTELDGTNPLILSGYGGYGVSISPRFAATNQALLDRGVIVAVANIRGGGEYGEAWHQQGHLTHKQNVFDDFYAVSRWLVDTGYTKPSRIAIGGRSNGGLLVGASITQHPEMCGAALPGVGVLDMLRFNKFTIGWAWESDYGSPQDPEMFEVLRSYSPLHNVKSGTAYPPTLITTADRDDRVVPYHSFKFAAAIQRAHAGPAPVMIRIETRAGHGAGKPTAMRIAEWTDSWAFVADALGMTLPEGF